MRRLLMVSVCGFGGRVLKLPTAQRGLSAQDDGGLRLQISLAIIRVLAEALVLGVIKFGLFTISLSLYGSLDMAKHWAQRATARMKKKGTEGSLTRAAHRAGYSSALRFAHHIEANPSDYSGKMRKKAAFAVNINK